MSLLAEASLRINESLELNTVLQGVLDSALSLNGADYGVVNTMNDSGSLEDFFTSGLTEQEKRSRLVRSPESNQFFRYLSGLSGPLRLPDLRSHIRSVGLPDFPLLPVGPYLAVPILHKGAGIGHIHLAKRKQNGEFTVEDEEALVLFASQATLVIANARRYRDEQRARADLETLVNTAPVGVLVFDGTTGAPVSMNGEARRIAGKLSLPGQPAEELLTVLTFRRADGREVSLEKFPLAQALREAEKLRAEEIVLHVPDGRSVTTIIDATPIYSENGELESAVVTIQDMTPLEDLDRLRAEFLAVVSHELRAPLVSIKGSAATLLESSSDLDRAEMVQFFHIINDQADHMRDLIGDLLDVARIETGTLSIAPAPVEVADLAEEARRKCMSGGGEEILHMDISPDLPLVMADSRRIVQVLVNLLSNASKASRRSTRIALAAKRQGQHVRISIEDDGRGISAELLPHLFKRFHMTDGDRPPLGLGEAGMGLAICKGIVEAHGGRIWAESDGLGRGARFNFTLPVRPEAKDMGSAGTGRTSFGSRRAKGERERILAVDDDPRALRYIRDALEKSGYAPIITGDPRDVPWLVEQNDPHLILLDLMLPETDGITLMTDILQTSDAPVIFVSAYTQEQYVARALEMGAVDYVVKPFSPTELAARIQAALRERAASEQVEPSEPYVLDDLRIDYAERAVTLGDRPVELTATEYRLLAELSANPGRVLTYSYILQRVWNKKARGTDLRPLRTVVKNLRRRLGEDANSPRYIFNVPRVGYRMAKAAACDESDSQVP